MRAGLHTNILLEDRWNREILRTKAWVKSHWAKIKGRQKSGGLCLRKCPGGGETHRLGLGAVLCAELGVSAPRTFVIRRTSTRRFLARPSAVLLSAAYLSLPIPIR